MHPVRVRACKPHYLSMPLLPPSSNQIQCNAMRARTMHHIAYPCYSKA